MEPLVVMSASGTALLAALLLKQLFPPPRRLRSRLAPYINPALTSFSASDRVGPLSTVFGPIIRDLAEWIGRLADRTGDEVSALKLKQAGWSEGASDQDLLVAYRVLLLRSVAVAVVIAVAVGQVMGASVLVRSILVGLAVVSGVARTKGRLDKTIESRRERMKIEIYTINQLMAMRVRAGGGVIQAVKAVCRRGSGEVVGELETALRLHRAGWSGPDAFRRIAELTPEAFCARTYRLLAAAEERGADLAGALLALAEDVRETRRESIKRTATKRRAAMLVPTIAILAPVLILFVAAPLPYLITGWR